MNIRAITKLAAGAALIAMTAGAAKAAEVEVLHWWTSGGEAAALNVLKENLAKEGVTWKDMPVAGGAGSAAMTALRARVTAGDPPTAVQLLGFDLRDWSEMGVAANLDDLAAKEGWDKVIPPALQEFSKYDGHWVAAPVNIHSTNWLWLNKAALDKAGGKVPTNIDELFALLDKFKADGIVPLAHGGVPWQDGTLWEAVVLSRGGPDFYKKAVLEADPEALSSDTMKKVFDDMSKLRTYFDPNFSGREWNLSTALVIEGKAGAQEMGDWSKGEWLRAKKEPGKDFVCIRFPGTQGSVLFNADQFMMFDVGGDAADAQMKMASAVENPAFQIAFNKVKGSVPARTDIPDTEFDDCAKKGMKDLAEASSKGTLMGSLAHGYAQPAAIKEAMLDVITQHLNGQLTTDAALKRLPEAVAAAK
ncbi:glucose/mannose transport system substrate-binding protein [Rhizobium cellulosilyticum]|jgi:glucose/mannose transport system substrate-binding protein|uniref:Probable sugar-binding periplasmic protein n=1 Tax=Aliirhizobium cellulosilyticum TaxID=393664 RepID=A0A7W6TCR6_9HYPH|nr:ABC transporter substrate-binding protein [Rhizobium cellulosilyticum]MBB4346513.1 glucose/mannose transport system substrate-binding protein [Rhizobium cellulosilyticum]MBB4411093.1 glucose/mannose transport system substrate-binding protein [Rhizobium cellulosilyticum]MBB4445782.1 glucose/mannose transport system substrate-binding protein [Rhizobium cellulosilyticum]